jgi:hypothetical protein
MENGRAEWWKEHQYASRYHPGESEQALENLFSVSDESWLAFTLEAWVGKGGCGHPLINVLAPQSLWPLVILVELGEDLEEIRHLSRFKELVEELRNPSKFMAALLESEIAAHWLRSGFSRESAPVYEGACYRGCPHRQVEEAAFWISLLGSCLGSCASVLVVGGVIEVARSVFSPTLLSAAWLSSPL